MTSRALIGRRIAVGIGGGIAAYKVCDLVRELRRAGAEIRVAMTPAAAEFIPPLTLQSLSGHGVLTDSFAQDHLFGHLHLARWAELFLIAPATADLLARIRAGMANDTVTTSLLAFRGPVLLAPAMNTAMWDNEATAANIRALLGQSRFHTVGPAHGALADGDVGLGRLAELGDIVDAAVSLLAQGPLAGKRVLVTAGPTREPIDPVRFVSNPSTGKMGLAVAEAARARGADVTVVLGPVADALRTDGLTVVPVVTADDMLAEVMSRIELADFFVAAAAVSDWKPSEVLPRKEKKSSGPQNLTMVPTPDVLARASALVHAQAKRPVLVGFAAQTHDVLASAKEKLEKKRLDFIVANDVTQRGSGFGCDTNRVTILGANGLEAAAEGSKREVADRLWDLLASRT